MGSRTRALATAAAGTAVGVALLAAPGASAGAGGAIAPSGSGGSQYGAPLSRVRTPRPVAHTFRVSPSVVTSPTLPQIAVRIDQRGASTVGARIVLLPQTEIGSIVRVDLGQVRTGQRATIAWPAGTELPPGRYLVRLHVRGLNDAVLARSARTSGKTTLTVRAPAPPPPTAPVPDAAGHVFPVAGPHTYGDGFGAPRNGYSHQGQDVLAAEGVPVVAPVAGSISFVDDQPSGAGLYVVEKGSDGYDYLFAHCQTGSVAVTPGQPVLAGAPVCAVGHTGDASGPHLHFEMWTGGWRVDATSAPLDPLPFLRAWDPAAAAAAPH
jgi:hypothetical protein